MPQTSKEGYSRISSQAWQGESSSWACECFLRNCPNSVLDHRLSKGVCSYQGNDGGAAGHAGAAGCACAEGACGCAAPRTGTWCPGGHVHLEPASETRSEHTC
eukprot:1149583-Pelagomonas_calceolata.AAC.2